jgi:hypothetical protein
LLARLFSLPVAALASLLLLITFLGCMSLQVGGDHRPMEIDSEEGVVRQSGTVTLRGDQPQTVYYPIPYISPPNLTIKDEWPHERWQLVDQKADHFSIRREPLSLGPPLEITWTAKGLKGPPAAPVVVLPKGTPGPTPAEPAAPAEPNLPPVPVPVTPNGQ